MSKKLIILIALIVLVFAASYYVRATYCGAGGSIDGEGEMTDSQYRQAVVRQLLEGPAPSRIISTVPSVTSTLFAIGAEDLVVGVSRYCKFPARVERLPKIGGFLDLNFEEIEKLRPDLVLLLQGNDRSADLLRRRGIRTLEIEHRTIEGLLESIELLGRICRTEERAKKLAGDLRLRLDRLESMAAMRIEAARGRPPRVLLVVERTRGTGRPTDVLIAGADGHMNRCLQLAGAENAYQGDVAFPLVSYEGLTELSPDIIIEIVPESQVADATREKLISDWSSLDTCPAVKNGRIKIIAEDRLTIPGPQVVDLVERLSELVWGESLRDSG